MADVELAGVRKSYGAHRVVDGIDLAVRDGEVVALLGASGCGKTTSLRAIAGLEAISGGTIRIGGEPVAAPGLHVPPEARRIGMVFQGYAVWPHLDVWDNVAFPLQLSRAPDLEDRVRRILSVVRLDGLERRRPGSLSGGQQQRVALARALVAEPRVLLLDEPLSNLDASLRVELREEIRSLVRRMGVTVVLVTHDQEEAFALADRVALMDAGRIAQVGPPRELYERPSTRVVAAFLGASEQLVGSRSADGVIVDGVAVPAHAVDGAPESGRCALAFRERDARLGAGGIPAEVVQTTWMGDRARVRVKVGETLVAAVDRGGAAVGDRVGLCVDVGFAVPISSTAPPSPTAP